MRWNVLQAERRAVGQMAEPSVLFAVVLPQLAKTLTSLRRRGVDWVNLCSQGVGHEENAMPNPSLDTPQDGHADTRKRQTLVHLSAMRRFQKYRDEVDARSGVLT